MLEEEVKKIANEAELVVNGYAFSVRSDGLISILNLIHPDCAMVVSQKCEIIETNMDEIEQHIVLELCRKNMQFIEE